MNWMTRIAWLLIFATQGVAMASTTCPICEKECAEWDCPQIQGTFSGTISFLSEYRFRGVTQSDEDPAIQGSIDWNHDRGWFAGLWGSNVDFNDGDQAHVELDLYWGWTQTRGCFTFSTQSILYFYPGASSSLHYDYMEWVASLGVDFYYFTATLYGYYSAEYFGKSGSAFYPQLQLEGKWCDNVTFYAHLGHQFIEKNSVAGLPDWWDWSLKVSWDTHGFTLFAQYMDTDLRKRDLSSGADPVVVFGISRSL